MTIPHRIGVLLAAGRGRRMGRTKQLVEWPSADGPKPLVAAAYDAVRPICDEMVVVLGHDAEAVAAALVNRIFHRAQSDADGPMLYSIHAGLAAALAMDPTATMALHPADHPEVAESTLRALVDWSHERPMAAIIPEHHGRGGHPVLIPAVVAQRILTAECPTGLADFWTANPELCLRIPVEDQAMLRDVDMPSDLL